MKSHDHWAQLLYNLVLNTIKSSDGKFCYISSEDIKRLREFWQIIPRNINQVITRMAFPLTILHNFGTFS